MLIKDQSVEVVLLETSSNLTTLKHTSAQDKEVAGALSSIETRHLLQLVHLHAADISEST
jgi:hypothetical protein